MHSFLKKKKKEKKQKEMTKYVNIRTHKEPIELTYAF